jgi:hypothetical protein
MPYRPSSLRWLLCALVAFAPAAAKADPPANLAQRVEALMHEYGVPGATVAIVENGRTTFAHGFGVTDLSAPHPVDADTIFSTGSTGKAFTVAALGHRARLAIALLLLVLCMLLAGRFGLVALIAGGYRALAYIMLAVFVLPLATLGVARIRATPPPPQPPRVDQCPSPLYAVFGF